MTPWFKRDFVMLMERAGTLLYPTSRRSLLAARELQMLHLGPDGEHEQILWINLDDSPCSSTLSVSSLGMNPG